MADQTTQRKKTPGAGKEPRFVFAKPAEAGERVGADGHVPGDVKESLSAHGLCHILRIVCDSVVGAHYAVAQNAPFG
jgi:hypothetical protein